MPWITANENKIWLPGERPTGNHFKSKELQMVQSMTSSSSRASRTVSLTGTGPHACLFLADGFVSPSAGLGVTLGYDARANNRLMELAVNDTSFLNFRYSKRLQAALSIVGPLEENLTVNESLVS